MIVRVTKKVEDINIPLSLANANRYIWNSKRRFR